MQSVGIILVILFSGQDLKSIGLGQGRYVSGTYRGLVWSFAFGVFAGVCGLILWLFGTNPLRLLHVNLPEEPLRLIYYYLLGGLLGPVAEELFYRGAIFGFFRRFSFIGAMAVSVLAFVFSHPSFGITQAAGGIVFVVAYAWEGKILTPITIHILGNLALFTLSLIFNL
jgi:hypothetical protein